MGGGASPIDDLRESLELAAANQPDAATRAANKAVTANDLWSVTPVVGNAMSAQDVMDAYAEAAKAAKEGNVKRTLGYGGLMALDTLGAVSGLPFGRAAGQAAKAGKDSVNIFAGVGSKTADHTALAQAKEMTAAGADRGDIWRDTGWYAGNDGKWRYEIDDSAAKLAGVVSLQQPRFFGREVGAPRAAMFSGLEHPALSDAYGEVPKIYGEYGPQVPKHSGSYLADPEGKLPPFIDAEAPTAGEARSVALHELQHDAQRKEDFSVGANTRQFGPKEVLFPDVSEAKRYFDELPFDTQKNTTLVRDSFSDQIKVITKLPYSTDPRDLYRRTAGEVEARNVQTRRNMSAAERLATPPWMTQDVPDEQQIINMILRSIGAK